MKRRTIILLLYFIGILIDISCSSKIPSVYKETGKDAVITPDYSGVTIPVNIAPLNFLIREKGTEFRVEFSNEKKDRFIIESGSGSIKIPIKIWKQFLENNTDENYTMTIYVKNESGSWEKFNSITNHISSDKIDPWIVYRRINAGMIFWENMDIVQRSLEDFTEKDIISNKNTDQNCMNCHSFLNRDPESFMLHMRRAPSGTILFTGNKKLWLNTKTSYTLSPFVYPAWHPNGNLIAFSTNKIHQNFFGTGDRLNHVRDEASDIVIYDINKNMTFTSPKIATLDFENMPSWSPDGKYLYYIKSPYADKFLHDTLEQYDLMRISFDENAIRWGDPETLLAADQTGLSISFPQVSPDGKYLVFCMADYGYFNINNTSSNLYLFDLSNNIYHELPVNSNVTESFPTWSDNSRWIMFTTKRIDGRYTVPYFTHIDSSGNAQKPFALPFETPEAFDTRLVNYNRPVFVKGKITIPEKTIVETVYTTPSKIYFDSIHVDLDALTGETINKLEAPKTSAPYMQN